MPFKFVYVLFQSFPVISNFANTISSIKFSRRIDHSSARMICILLSCKVKWWTGFGLCQYQCLFRTRIEHIILTDWILRECNLGKERSSGLWKLRMIESFDFGMMKSFDLGMMESFHIGMMTSSWTKIYLVNLT